MIFYMKFFFSTSCFKRQDFDTVWKGDDMESSQKGTMRQGLKVEFLIEENEQHI